MTSSGETIAVIGGDFRNVPVAGSIEGRCTQCPNRVWLSPASQELIANGAEVICWPCYRALPDDDKRLQGESPEGVNKLRRGQFPFGERRSAYMPGSGHNQPGAPPADTDAS